MQLAIEEAKQAYSINEVPVGAVLVKDGRVIARSHNLVEVRRDASCHAELLCLAAAAKILENWRLTGTTLYCTLEPCTMCAGAMLLYRIERLVWGAKDVRHGAHGSWVNLLDRDHPTHSIEVSSGVLACECSELMSSFFQKRRLEKVSRGINSPL
jgi:tRNA(adenine34) deaminase